MSKYNNIKSIPIENISKGDLNQAIKEWAEGDEALERLLWSCYNNGIRTTGCHSGKRPYLGIEYEEKNKDIISVIIDSTLDEKQSQVLITPDGGNPFSGPTWYRPDIAIGLRGDNKNEARQFFNKISNSINSKEINKNYSSVIDLLDFLINKYSDLTIRLIHSQNEEYIFLIEKRINEEDIDTFNKLNKIFSQAGLLLIEDEKSSKCWTVKTNSKIDFINKLRIIANNIINNYTIEPPKTIDEAKSFLIKAHIKRKEYIESGKEGLFEIWISEERKKLEEQFKNAYLESQKNK